MTARAVRSWLAAKNPLHTMPFRQDGKVLATGGGDETVVLWNVEDPARPTRALTLDGHQSFVEALVFGSGGREPASYASGEVIRWKAADRSGPRVTGVFQGAHSVTVFDLSPDGRLVAAGGFDERVTLWDLGDPRRPRRIVSLPGHTAGISALSFSADGRALVSGDDQGDVILRDLADRKRPRRAAILHRPEAVRHLVFALRGTTLISVEGPLFGTDTAHFWDVGDLAKPRKAGRSPGASPLAPPRFRRDGKALAFAGGITTYLWNLEPDSKPVELPTGASYPAYSWDGHWLATEGDRDGSPLALWNVEDLRHPRRVGEVKGQDQLVDLPFHPQGNLLVGADREGHFTLWAVGERSPPHQVAVLDDHHETAKSAQFTPDGRYLLTSDRSSLYVWDLDDHPQLSADTVGRACAVAGGGLTKQEWGTYAPGLAYEPTCGGSRWVPRTRRLRRPRPPRVGGPGTPTRSRQGRGRSSSGLRRPDGARGSGAPPGAPGPCRPGPGRACHPSDHAGCQCRMRRWMPWAWTWPGKRSWSAVGSTAGTTTTRVPAHGRGAPTPNWAAAPSTACCSTPPIGALSSSGPACSSGPHSAEGVLQVGGAVVFSVGPPMPTVREERCGEDLRAGARAVVAREVAPSGA